MPDASIFNVAGTEINVKDASAQSKAEAAQSTATQALNLTQSIEDLTRVEVPMKARPKPSKLLTGPTKAKGGCNYAQC